MSANTDTIRELRTDFRSLKRKIEQQGQVERENRGPQRISIALLIAGSSALLHGSLAAESLSPTPDDFFKRGTPTFVVGTAGDELVDRAISAQAGMVRDLLFPTAKIIADSALDT